MLSFEEMGDLLDEIAEEFPEEFYRELNGGILLLPEALPDPDFPPGELYILGEYCREWGMGRFINLYYGSFAALFADADLDELRDELKKTLAHEFTHHVESLAGERGLEIRDEEELEGYRSEYRTESKD
ncbi:MAG: hypothetical protein H6Q60_143 [Oscillospiraceae bacterium]|nr:hypothetical protein [Oscillospiraceae bacterium]